METTGIIKNTKKQKSATSPCSLDLRPIHLRLGSLKSSRATFARIIRAYNDNKLEEKVFRGLVWAMGLYINYLKAEDFTVLEKRIAALEERQEEQ
jgi:hypothetical protein